VAAGADSDLTFRLTVSCFTATFGSHRRYRLSQLSRPRLTKAVLRPMSSDAARS
jgi:hypothetical protein